MKTIDTMHPAVAAGDYLMAAVGQEGARLALWAFRADWLLQREADVLEPLAAAIAYLLKEEVPKHRGRSCKTKIVQGDVGAAVSQRLRIEGG